MGWPAWPGYLGEDGVLSQNNSLQRHLNFERPEFYDLTTKGR